MALGCPAPRVKCAEAPNMTFKIAAGKSAAAVIFGFDIEQDFGASRLGSLINRVGIGDDHINGLSCAAANFIGLLHVLAEVGVALRAQHDHAIAESKLRVHDLAVVAWIGGAFFEAE